MGDNFIVVEKIISQWSDDVKKETEIIDNIDKTKKFRLCCSKILLTYKTHLDKKEYEKWFQGLIGFKPKFIRLAHENGLEDPITPYEHTHIIIDFGKKIDYSDERKFDYNKIHPHIKKIISQLQWKNSLIYIAKEDKDNLDLLTSDVEKGINVEKIWSEPSLQAALLNHTENNLSNVLHIKTLYECKIKDNNYEEFVINDEKLYQWQKQVLDIINKPIDDRAVYWIYDKVGNKGKSIFAKHLMALNNDTYIVSNVGKISDFSTIVLNALDSGWNGKNFILDLPRRAEDFDISVQLEDIKNGKVTATKYQGKTVLFRSPNVFVFANFLPIKGDLSIDRWKIYNIEEIKNDELSLNNEYAYHPSDDNSGVRQMVNKTELIVKSDYPPWEITLREKSHSDFALRRLTLSNMRLNNEGRFTLLNETNGPDFITKKIKNFKIFMKNNNINLEDIIHHLK